LKKLLCLLCALLLSASLLAACNKKPGGSGAPADNLADVLHPRNYEFSADWPENEFTAQLPKPGFQTTGEEPGEREYSVVCDATVEQMKEYVESLKAAGFTENENTMEENAFGVYAYYYTASNAEGYTVEVNYSTALGNMATLAVKKPS
jgi:hypothetical protein